MEKSQKVFNRLCEKKLIALLTPKTMQDCIIAYKTLNPLGIILEIALRSEAAIDGLTHLLQKYPDALVLAGTVITKAQAEKAIKAGVAGIVSPDYFTDIVDLCLKSDIMCIPGGLADPGKQLAQKADILGCDLNELRQKYPYQWLYKLFPAQTRTANNMGLSKAWQGPFQGLKIIYTGGISIENLYSAVRLDPDGIFCGSALTKSIDQPQKMQLEAEKWLEIIHGTGERHISTKPKKINKVVTFGEIMLRLAPPNHLRFVQTKSYDAAFGGAEANTAVAFANYGLDSCFVSVLPEHEIGQAAINSLRMYGVNIHYVLRQGKRVGIYFLEYGASQRPSKVVYDRAGSAISEIQPGQIDWQEVFQDAKWFHWSGITPALSDSAAAVTLEAVRAAKKAGVTVSADLNYRKKLWTQAKAQQVMSGLMSYTDIAIGNEEDAECVFDIKAGSTDVISGKLDVKGYQDVCRQMAEKFGLKKVAITLRESISASENRWSACLFNGEQFYQSKKYHIQLIDRVGGGDSFCSGLIYGFIIGKSDLEALEFGVAASCLKQTIHGDFNLVSVEEVEKLMGGDASGRVQR